ncbi:3-deoxy-alpha-D-manno-octulosonate 8-oxidase [Lutibacter sp. Hel_I_33_5]|uniref:iron-containing alcohol dehydrogenase family protein n=1 Tax=Lutibacter sp. Hel_I_33_5 TaxID=1566289 RepID=UPI0011A7C260|nr:iron-containing alcohol dehydrogenase family protein [Lutibacter sp. Hel_I_33_5]TVZ55510.1 3-deoxy-alpha-D-manno-octulosonate 8-oxidase [Lutibacter sp. Hel_I_33_5]
MKNILNIEFGFNAMKKLNEHPKVRKSHTIFFVDIFFKNSFLIKEILIKEKDFLYFVDSTNELTTTDVNNVLKTIKETNNNYEVVVGIGGGTSLDFAKAISNLLTNKGTAEDYQGWDLVKTPGVYKIGIPTLSGTGAESSKTCVMINLQNGLKLGMNSNHTVYDELILDPSLAKTVPKEQFFYTGMDTYIHCIESLNGSHRHPLSDAYSNQALDLARQVFQSEDMMSDKNREKMMVASYFGGVAIANSFVGVVHPISAGLSVVLGIHHCEANCITMTAMEEFYPAEYNEFMKLVEKNQIKLRRGLCQNLSKKQYDDLFDASTMHEIPLKNALGLDFKKILTKEKVIELYKKM